MIALQWLVSSSGHSVTESMKAFSGDGTSGTQIWIGRIPWARNCPKELVHQ